MYFHTGGNSRYQYHNDEKESTVWGHASGNVLSILSSTSSLSLLLLDCDLSSVCIHLWLTCLNPITRVSTITHNGQYVVTTWLFLFFSENDLKGKIQRLRSSYTRELRKEKASSKSGSSADAVYCTKWKYFKSLHFLRPHVTLREGFSNMVRTYQFVLTTPSPNPHQQLQSCTFFPQTAWVHTTLVVLMHVATFFGTQWESENTWETE